MTHQPLLAFALTMLALPLHSQPAAGVLEVTGAVARPLRLTSAALAEFPRAGVETSNGGVAVKYEGVWLHEVLKKAGVPSGTELRGKALASHVISDAANMKPLGGADGSFRLAAPKDKRGARSIRMLTRLEAVQLRK